MSSDFADKMPLHESDKQFIRVYGKSKSDFFGKVSFKAATFAIATINLVENATEPLGHG